MVGRRVRTGKDPGEEEKACTTEDRGVVDKRGEERLEGGVLDRGERTAGEAEAEVTESRILADANTEGRGLEPGLELPGIGVRS